MSGAIVPTRVEPDRHLVQDVPASVTAILCLKQLGVSKDMCRYIANFVLVSVCDVCELTMCVSKAKCFWLQQRKRWNAHTRRSQLILCCACFSCDAVIELAPLRCGSCDYCICINCQAHENPTMESANFFFNRSGRVRCRSCLEGWYHWTAGYGRNGRDGTYSEYYSQLRLPEF